MIKMIVKQDYWNKSYNNLKLTKADEEDPTSKLLDKFLSPVKKKKMIEIGCFPGRFLSIISKKGYLINGIDLYHNTPKTLTPFLVEQGIEFGNFIVGDFNQYEFNEQFDLVCSFGFVEHFKNYSEVIAKHCEILAPNGILIITAPNFSGGLQRTLHALMDRENYSRHNIESMNLDLWEQAIQTKNFKIMFKGYYGVFDFWTDHSEKKFLLSFCIRIVRKILMTLFKKINIDMKFSSPYMAIIARRK
jgi:SAM-dependent methyltransferase